MMCCKVHTKFQKCRVDLSNICAFTVHTRFQKKARKMMCAKVYQGSCVQGSCNMPFCTTYFKYVFKYVLSCGY